MKLAAIVLAAGKATRFGSDKLAAQFLGEPLVSHAVRAAKAAPVSRVIMVCNPSLELDTGAIELVAIESPALSASLQAGIAAAGEVDGAFVFLGDMPLVPHDIAGQLAALLGENYAALPRCKGQPGHPVLLSQRSFADIAHLQGDEGAGRLLRGRNDVAFLETADDAVLFDIDRIEDLARMERRMAGPQARVVPGRENQ